MRTWCGAGSGLLRGLLLGVSLTLGCSRPNAAFEPTRVGDARAGDVRAEAPVPTPDGPVADRAADPSLDAAAEIAPDVAPDLPPPADLLPADAPPADRPPPDAPAPDAPPPDAPPPDVREAPLPVGTGLRGQYYDGSDLERGNTGELEMTRTDETVNFDWGTGRVRSDIDDDWFSVRWTGKVMPLHSETYTFRTVSDEGVRLWVNNRLLFEDWNATGQSVTRSATIALQAYQQYDIRLEYFEATGTALVRLYWMSPSQPLQIIPRERLFPP